MEFGLSEEQLMLTESLRGFLAERLPMDKLRKIAESGLGFDGELWSGLVEQGIMGIMVPEDFGGLGLSLLDAAVAAEVLGYHAAPTPFAAALVMAPLALIASGGRAQQAAWLPRIASGEVRIGVGFAGMSSVQTGKAFARLDGSKLSGCITGALDGGDATHFIVYLNDGRAAGREIARLATEVHGGMGFTDLLGLHYWFKRIAFNRQLLGSPERCRHEAALAQEWVS